MSALTPSEQKAYRMGVLRGLELAASHLRERGFNGSSVVAVEHYRIAIAARSVACDPPREWPQRGGK